MQVDGERIHCDYFAIEGAGEFCETAGCLAMIGQPGTLRMKVSINRVVFPVGEFLVNVVDGQSGLQAK